MEFSPGRAILRTGVLVGESLAIGIREVANGSYTCVARNEDVTNNFTVSIQAYG